MIHLLWAYLIGMLGYVLLVGVAIGVKPSLYLKHRGVYLIGVVLWPLFIAPTLVMAGGYVVAGLKRRQAKP